MDAIWGGTLTLGSEALRFWRASRRTATLAWWLTTALTAGLAGGLGWAGGGALTAGSTPALVAKAAGTTTRNRAATKATAVRLRTLSSPRGKVGFNRPWRADHARSLGAEGGRRRRA